MVETVRKDARGRRFGSLMVALGVVLLLAVFALALVSFAGIPAQMRAPAAATLEGAGRVLGLAAARALLLFVMAFAASLLASKGIELLAVGADRPRL